MPHIKNLDAMVVWTNAYEHHYKKNPLTLAQAADVADKTLAEWADRFAPEETLREIEENKAARVGGNQPE
jgi:hypothetical protein